MLAFDKHMNLVLAECEEFRKVKVSHTSLPAPSSIAPSGADGHGFASAQVAHWLDGVVDLSALSRA